MNKMAVCNGLGDLVKLTTINYIDTDGTYVAIGTGTTPATPHIGMIYINTTLLDAYVSMGTTGVNSWRNFA